MRPTPRMFDREREVRRRRRLLERLSSPRMSMALIAALTGAAGLLASYLLRLAGMSSMALRYPLAVGLAYLAFLFFLWCWLNTGRRHEEDDETVVETVDLVSDGAEWVPSRSNAANDSTAADLLDRGGDSGGSDVDVGDAGDLVGIVVIGFVLLATALFTLFSMVSLAPVLFAELLVDAALAGGLYRYVRGIDRERHWLKTALAHTGWRFAAVAAVAAAIGFTISRLVPGASSIGDLLR